MGIFFCFLFLFLFFIITLLLDSLHSVTLVFFHSSSSLWGWVVSNIETVIYFFIYLWKENHMENNTCLTFFWFQWRVLFCLNLNKIFSAIFELHRRENAFIFFFKRCTESSKNSVFMLKAILYFKFVSGKNLELKQNDALSYKSLSNNVCVTKYILV